MAPPGESETPGRKQQTHDRILDTAAGALRAGGFAGVGVADIMKRAGLTHGGFYAHFASRDVLLAEALQRAGEDSQARLAAALAAGEARGLGRFEALVKNYLSERHLNAPESGCPVAALASEVPRQSAEVQAVAATRVQSLVATVRRTLPEGTSDDTAALIAGQLVGALQLARALGNTAQGKRHLKTVRDHLIATYAPSARGAV